MRLSQADGIEDEDEDENEGRGTDKPTLRASAGDVLLSSAAGTHSSPKRLRRASQPRSQGECGKRLL